ASSRRVPHPSQREGCARGLQNQASTTRAVSNSEEKTRIAKSPEGTIESSPARSKAECRGKISITRRVPEGRLKDPTTSEEPHRLHYEQQFEIRREGPGL